jgi:hypothetical protein
MRGLTRFLLLCGGLTLLLAFCLVAFVTAVGIGGIFIAGLGLWFLLGIPLAFALFVGGMGLCVVIIDDVESNDDGPVNRVFFGSVVIAFIAMLVAFIPGVFAGPQIYQKYYGEKTTAVVTSILTNNDENGGVIKYHYFVQDDTTGEDLGALARTPSDETVEGDRIEVVVDPRGWVPPVAAAQLGQTTVPAVILACCFAVILLAALAVLATALGALASARLREAQRPSRDDAVH